MRIVLWLAGIVVVALFALYAAGAGWLSRPERAGAPQAPAVGPEPLAQRAASTAEAARDLQVKDAKQVLFGDLHVHTTFSFDAFQMSLPMAGGDGAHPVADACDFARHCAGLDFWSINDHAITLTPRRWDETIDSVRQCNAIAGDQKNPDLVSYLGWEWTQVGTTPENHWGHKNVILKNLDDEEIPTRPISAGTPPGLVDLQASAPSPILVGALAAIAPTTGGPQFAKYMAETLGVRDCPNGVPVRDLPADCREIAPTPADLFAKLDDWDHEALVIPHGTSWGFYTPPGASWEKQLTAEQHSPRWQSLIEVFSGHGNSEEYRNWNAAIPGPDGGWECPEPTPDHLPSCWRAGEIIEARCLDEGGEAAECSRRASIARRNFVEAPFNSGFLTVPGTKLSDWQDAGQCRDCFLPSFNHRPKNSVQYIMALGRPEQAPADRFRFGFLAASDNHSARPGTGYKEFSRREFTEARFARFLDTPLSQRDDREPSAESATLELENLTVPFANFETERGASFLMTGGLTAVHAAGRDRGAIWDALQRREVYGTSGPRILLWFDLINDPLATLPMGSEVSLEEAPRFRVRAAGSFEQDAGCPAPSEKALGAARLARLCQGECYRPSDIRRPIARIEIVRIRPQLHPGEDVADLIDDPWRVLPCPADGGGCDVSFIDEEFVGSGRDALYYARAIETPSQAIGADPLGCTRDAAGRCTGISPCVEKPWTDDCLSATEERAWSSPIFVNRRAPATGRAAPSGRPG